jgi:uncharacterized protein
MTTNSSSDEPWIQTYVGKKFFWRSPRVEDIDIVDIAHALSMLCRFNGHCKQFYSVAEHCVHVSHVTPPGIEFAGLLHDASEAYFSDLPSPIKRKLPDVQAIEDKLHQVICKKFGLAEPDLDDVKGADARMLFTEKAVLMEPIGTPWPGEAEYKPFPNVTLECWAPDVAKRKFLERFEELTA